MMSGHGKRLVASLCFCVLSSASLVSPAHGIIGGIPDVTTNNVVVALHRLGQLPYCSGTLVAPTWVLTAAHCIWNDSIGGVDPYVTQVRVSTTAGYAGFNGASSAIRSVIPHPNYTTWRTGYDLALLKVDDVFGGQFAQLASAEEIRASADIYSTVVVSGFGLTSVNGSTSSVALEVTQTLIEQTLCSRSLPNSISSVGSTILCIAGDAGHTACNGDSGGPLFILTTGGRKLAGATSFGSIPCTNARGYYTNISSYVSFLTTYGIGVPATTSPQVTVPAALPGLPNSQILPPSSPILQSPSLPGIEGSGIKNLPKFTTSRTFQLVLEDSSRNTCTVDIDGPPSVRGIRFSIFVSKQAVKPLAKRLLNEFGDTSLLVRSPCSSIRTRGIFLLADGYDVKVRVIE